MRCEDEWWVRCEDKDGKVRATVRVKGEDEGDGEDEDNNVDENVVVGRSSGYRTSDSTKSRYISFETMQPACRRAYLG